jgi:hypothetical protein
MSSGEESHDGKQFTHNPKVPGSAKKKRKATSSSSSSYSIDDVLPHNIFTDRGADGPSDTIHRRWELGLGGPEVEAIREGLRIGALGVVNMPNGPVDLQQYAIREYANRPRSRQKYIARFHLDARAVIGHSTSRDDRTKIKNYYVSWYTASGTDEKEGWLKEIAWMKPEKISKTLIDEYWDNMKSIQDERAKLERIDQVTAADTTGQTQGVEQGALE